MGLPCRLFQPIKPPGTLLGRTSPRISCEIGYSTNVVLAASHDTASAVMAIPDNQPTLFISSGTWSLMGTERSMADCSDKSRRLNFTSEGGYDYRYRFLKNIMGLWLIQNLKKELNHRFSFSELCKMAESADIDSVIDCNDKRFLAPKSMIKAVNGYCREKGMQVPKTVSESARVMYQSLAKCYKNTAAEIEAVTGKRFDKIHIIGGGANADYLNRLTAQASGKTVCAGPVEATAIGNLMCQMISAGELPDLQTAREWVKNSFEIKYYRKDNDSYDNQRKIRCG